MDRVASRARARKLTARKSTSLLARKTTSFPDSKGALPVFPVTPGANLTGAGLKALARTRPPNRELGFASKFTHRGGQVNKVLTLALPLSGDRDTSSQQALVRGVRPALQWAGNLH